MNLTLEVRNQLDKTAHIGPVVLTPPVDEDYWAYRVKLSPTGNREGQAVIGFPKFGTIGVGFAVEEDWNTNLPYASDPKRLADHISHNRLAAGDEAIARADVLEAIRMIREAVAQDPEYGKVCTRCAGARADAWRADPSGEYQRQEDDHWVEECTVHPPGWLDEDAYAEPGQRDDDGWPIKNYDEDEEA